jgi:hypothetical protein
VINKGPGPVQQKPLNSARSGRKQRYGGPSVCRRITWPRFFEDLLVARRSD